MEKIYITICLALLCVMPVKAEENNDYESQSDNQELGLGYISEGTVWEYAGLVLKQDFDPNAESIPDVFETRYYRDWIEGTEIIDGVTYMKVYSASDATDYQVRSTKYIRTENEKVYLLAENEEGVLKEDLLFDYSLRTGDKIDVSLILNGLIASRYKVSLTCINTENETFANKPLTTMKMEISEIDGNPGEPLFTPIKWIIGIGSETGLFDNVQSPESGGTRLLSVYHNGELVYQPHPSGINDVIDEMKNEIINNKKYHIDGREFREGDSGIYIQNGRKVMKSH